MRAGSFLVPHENHPADISIVSLPGSTGGLLANVNMWRTQLELPRMDETELQKITTLMKISGKQATWIDLTSKTFVIDKKYQARILAAIVSNGEQTWFFKMTGENSLVTREKAAFTKFLQSIRFLNDP